jgi:gliding motility-associated-like protein
MVYDKANNLSFCFQNVWVEIDENSVKPDAGPNSIICESDLFNITEASAPEFAAIKWTTNGTGTFNDPTVVNAVYVPSQSDIANGYAMLTITTTTGCAVASDQMVLTIFKTPVVSAGADAVICETENFQITTNVSSGIQSIEWKTTGTGTFSNPSAQNPIYYPGETDIETGNVELIITGIGAGTCPNVSDTMMLHIERQAIVDAGSDGWICENGDYFLADASVLYSENVLWTTNGTGSFEDAKQINATYKPSAGDVVNGSVILTITNTTTGQCNTSTDNLVLSISQHPTGNAGGNIATCFEQPITINGAKAENASSVHWSTNGTGILENENTISPTYIPGANEIGTINFQLQITGENACAGDTVVDEIELRIYDKLVVDAGADQTIFFNNSTKLAANVEYGSGKYFYSWQPAGAVFDANAKSTETYNLTSTTDFEITVTDANSQCVASDLVTVFVEEEEDNLLNIFNAFSPNNDGVNDKWIIEGIENFPENNVKFFNRWGDKLREFQNYNNVNSVWDGTNEKGNLVPDGTYFYILTITGSKTYTGWVQIRSVQ